jgi:hypothetical protein
VTSGRASGGPSRGADAPTRTNGTRDGIGAIVAILALGLVFRLIIAQLNPGSGFKVDLGSFQAWAGNLAQQGLHGFYERPFFHDYTPGYLYVLYVVGIVGRALGGIGDLIKIPPILADVAIGWLVWSMARELGAGRRAALIGGALAVANPVSWLDSVLWGQVDSFGVVFLLLGLRALWRDQPERSAIFTVIAALIKPQLAILAPIVAVVTIRRALWPDGATESQSDAALSSPRTGILARFRAWEAQTDQPIRILTTGVAGFLTAVALCFPFGLSVIEPGTNGQVLHSGLIEQVFKTAGGYPYASVNAYNPWALASVNGTGVAANSGWACDTIIRDAASGIVSCPAAVMIAGVPAVYVGAGLLAIAFVLVCLAVAWRPTPAAMLTGLAILAVAFFVLPTRVHERYLYPIVAIGAILAAVSIRWRVAYVVLSATTFLNMYVVLTTLYVGNPRITDWLGIGNAIRSTEGVTAVALTGLAASLWAFTQLRPGAQRALEREIDTGAAADEMAGAAAWAEDESEWPEGPPEPDDDRAPRRWQPGALVPAPIAGVAPGPGAAAGAMALSAPLALPTWSEPPSLAELGPIAWFRAKLDERPIRADRSRALHDEPAGRLDKLDVWILVVLLASML